LLFWGKVQRRGADVNVPKIGSRDGVCCSWGNLRVLRCFTKRIYLEELRFGGFWGFWAVGLRGVGGGGALMCFLCVLGDLVGSNWTGLAVCVWVM
jgi:hypothetical protein